MASLASVATTVPQFTAPKASPARCSMPLPAPSPRRLLVRASSMKSEAAAVAVATGASLLLAGSALSMEVLLGGNDGSLAFVPSEFSVSSGEEIVFLNNAGFPHNVVFDEDEVPGGVDADKLGMDPEDLLNAKGDTFKVTLSEKGTYAFYCAPHQGAGMVGKVTVN